MQAQLSQAQSRLQDLQADNSNLLRQVQGLEATARERAANPRNPLLDSANQGGRKSVQDTISQQKSAEG